MGGKEKVRLCKTVVERKSKNEAKFQVVPPEKFALQSKLEQ